MTFSDIVSSTLETQDLNLVRNVANILANDVNLHEEERAVMRTLIKSIELGSVPSYEFMQVSSAGTLEEPSTSIDKVSLLSAVSVFLGERKNKNVSKGLIKIAADISKGGMTDATYKELSGIVASSVRTEDMEYENPLDNPEEQYEQLLKTTSGLKFGVRAIDDAIGGIHPGSFNVIFAYTGGFKTTSAINVAYNNVLNSPINVVYISLEVVKKDLMWDIYSRHSFEMHAPEYNFIPHEKMRRGTLTDGEKKFLFEKVVPDWKAKKKGELFILDETDFKSLNVLGFEKALRNIEELANKKTGHGIDCIFIDQAQLLKYGGSSDIGNEGSVINFWVSWFRQQCISFLGTERPIAVIMLSQANREGWKRACKNEGSYDLRAISEANELERAAWRIFAIFTDENMKQSKEAKVQLLKNRTGQTVVDPVTIFVDPVAYVFGDVGTGFNDTISMDSLDDIFSSTLDDFNI